MKTKILIVKADYYLEIATGLQAAAEVTLNTESISKVKYKIIKVPGIFEIPVIIAKNIKKYDGFIALGCVIKGETPHFDFISKTTFDAIMKLSVDHKKPIGNGIITALDFSQAGFRSSSEERPKGSRFDKPNKGREAARAVLSILGILKNESKWSTSES